MGLISCPSVRYTIQGTIFSYRESTVFNPKSHPIVQSILITFVYVYTFLFPKVKLLGISTQYILKLS